jgi:hypothetical protein
LYVKMEMLQHKPLHNYNIWIKRYKYRE